MPGAPQLEISRRIKKKKKHLTVPYIVLKPVPNMEHRRTDLGPAPVNTC